LAYCGLRWSELAALRVDHVDLLRARLHISEAVTEVNGGVLAWGVPKSYEARSVPLPRFLVAELASILAVRSGRDLVFTTVNGDVLRNRNARRSWFDRAATAIGQVKAVQRMLGHASAAMRLDIYADLFDSDLDAVADRLDGVRSAAHDRVRTSRKLVSLR